MASDFKETETMINELMNLKIPEFKNSSNHVQLVEQGLFKNQSSLYKDLQCNGKFYFSDKVIIADK